uniref:Bromodomain adjacent to zinc finger domain protein 2A n=1 Tax=Elaeophora elaphi TaxID=1147741 RepID=A0A158Q737_9BILA
MPAFSEYFVRNATPSSTPSSLPSSSLKNGFGQHCRFNGNVAYVHYWCNPLGGMQQYPALFADYFAGTFIPMSNIWPYCHYHHSVSPKRSFLGQQPAAVQYWPADGTVNQIPETSVYVTQPRLGKQRDTSPLSSGISRSNSTASSDYADSVSSGIGSQDSYHQQEESGNFPSHVAITSSSDTSHYSQPQFPSLGDNGSENSGPNTPGPSPLTNFGDYDFTTAGFYSQKQQSQPQSTELQSQGSSDLLVTAYSASYPSAMKFYNLRKIHLARKGNGSSAGNLRFRTGSRFENILSPAATCFHVYQSPNRFLIPLEAVETYIHCLGSFSAQLGQSQIISAQAPSLPEFETTRLTSDLSSRATNTTINVTAETPNACDNIQTAIENVSSVSCEIDSRTSNILGNAADENDCPTLSADKPDKIVQDHFLDEDSLLENLPKFEHYSGGGSGLPCELIRNINWLQSKSPNAKLGFEFCGSDGYASKQRKQVLQSRNNHRSTGIPTRGTNEGRPRGLSPSMPAYHQLNDNNWRRHSQNGPPSKNYAARLFSTSDGYVRNRERNSYDK